MYPITDTYYGTYRTRTFSDIFPEFEEFEAQFTSSPLNISFTGGISLSQLYYMLYAHYGNSHIAYSDENQFKYYLYSIIFQYGPTAAKEREIQDNLRNISESDLRKGGRAIYNHAYNPGTPPSTSTLTDLNYINDQNTANYEKSKVEGYAILISLLKKDVLDEFIHRFASLFIKVAASDAPLLYETLEENY